MGRLVNPLETMLLLSRTYSRIGRNYHNQSSASTFEKNILIGNA